jgi:hypothetical protein
MLHLILLVQHLEYLRVGHYRDLSSSRRDHHRYWAMHAGLDKVWPLLPETGSHELGDKVLDFHSTKGSRSFGLSEQLIGKVTCGSHSSILASNASKCSS